MPGNTHHSYLNGTRSTEWLLSFCAIGWGLIILQPSETFNNLNYGLMKQLMTERSWGIMAIAIGVIRCTGLYINGWWKRSPLIRGSGSFFSGLFWLALCFLMIWSSKQYDTFLPIGVLSFYPVFFIFEGWCLFSAAYDAQKNGALNGSTTAVGRV